MERGARWWTPCLAKKHLPTFPAINAVHVKFVYPLLINLHALRFIPALYSFYISPAVHIVRNAFFVSKKAA